MMMMMARRRKTCRWKSKTRKRKGMCRQKKRTKKKLQSWWSPDQVHGSRKCLKVGGRRFMRREDSGRVDGAHRKLPRMLKDRCTMRNC
jgi:hypothetical protein